MALEIVLQVVHHIFWDKACPALISFRVFCGKEDGAILEVDVLELNLGKLAHSATKLKDELQYKLVPEIVNSFP